MPAVVSLLSTLLENTFTASQRAESRSRLSILRRSFALEGSGGLRTCLYFNLGYEV